LFRAKIKSAPPRHDTGQVLAAERSPPRGGLGQGTPKIPHDFAAVAAHALQTEGKDTTKPLFVYHRHLASGLHRRHGPALDKFVYQRRAQAHVAADVNVLQLPTPDFLAYRLGLESRGDGEFVHGE